MSMMVNFMALLITMKEKQKQEHLKKCFEKW